MPTPGAYRETAMDATQWKPAEPGIAQLPPEWWALFGDPQLGELIAQAQAANQTLREAEARYRQARALTKEARAGLFPTAAASVQTGRARGTTLGVQQVVFEA